MPCLCCAASATLRGGCIGLETGRKAITQNGGRCRSKPSRGSDLRAPVTMLVPARLGLRTESGPRPCFSGNCRRGHCLTPSLSVPATSLHSAPTATLADSARRPAPLRSALGTESVGDRRRQVGLDCQASRFVNLIGAPSGHALPGSARAGENSRLPGWQGGLASRYDSRSKCSLRVWAADLASRSAHIKHCAVGRRLPTQSLLTDSVGRLSYAQCRDMSRPAALA
jgi:hypothetical protein